MFSLERNINDPDVFDSLDQIQIRQYIVNRFKSSSTMSTLRNLQNFTLSGSLSHPNWGSVEILVNGTIQLSNNNSVNRFVQGWIFLSGWYAALESSAKDFDHVENFVLIWIEQYGSLQESDLSYKTVYHDETTAQRLAAAIHLHHLCMRHKRTRLISELQRLMDQTAALLYTDDFYAGKNNHGMFQAKSLRDYAVYADWAEHATRSNFLARSLTRISEYFAYSFTSEGVHIEHSPSYHLMIARHIHEHSLFMEAAFGVIPPELSKILASAESHTIHCVQPDGKFLPLSDTAQVALSGARNNVFNSEEFAYVSSCGSRGSEPGTRTLSEPVSGYFFHRTSWSDSSAGYLAFIAAYNGAYHKHSDDLHVYLWKYGYELLTEAGPFGYQMQDAMTKYAFSQFAHNSIALDYKSLPRHDRKYDHVSMTRSRVGELGEIYVRASNSRFTGTTHNRSLFMSDDLQRIRVVDKLSSESNHIYSLIWNFGPFLRVEIFENYVIGCIDSLPVIRLDFSGVDIQKIVRFTGRSGSRPRGWRFPSFGHKVPGSQIQVIFEGRSESVTTLITTFDFEAKKLGNSTPKQITSLQETPKVSSALPSIPHEGVEVKDRQRSQFGTLLCLNHVLRLDRCSKDTRAVIRIYYENELIHEHRGLVKSMAFTVTRKGRYRARIFPKGANHAMKAFTSDWVLVP
ncbi:heparinase II/III family protein [Glutamicibacter sp. NPDC087673]|uniref:heparinase II/III domain-containing protein n=1 Tax=Glutamicibacter sp. NPDC087673 TaxID=3363997 RepID=UPI0038014D0B